MYLLIAAAKQVRSIPLRVSSGVVVNPGYIFGGNVLQKLVNGAAFLGLLACVLCIIAGASMWGFGSRAGNSGIAGNGKSWAIGGVLGAVLIGSAAALVNFAHALGQTAH